MPSRKLLIGINRIGLKVCQLIRKTGVFGYRGAVALWAVFHWLDGAAVTAQVNNVDLHIVTHTGGNEQRIRALQFSRDSSQLYVAGHDKRVYVWNLLQNNQGHLQEAVSADPIFWEVARGRRGTIEDFSLSSQGRLAIAGTAARSNGDIVLFDSRQRLVQGVFPAVRAAAPDENSGHIATVTDVDWSPSGKLMASIDVAGRIHVWNAINRNLLHSFDTDDLNRNDRAVSFLTEETLLVSCNRASAGNVGVINLQAAQPALALLPKVHVGNVRAIASLPDTDLWASSDLEQNLHFWRANTLERSVSLAPPAPANADRRFAMSLHTAGPAGRYLLANVQIYRTDANSNVISAGAELQIWDMVANPPQQVDAVTFGAAPGLRATISVNELWVAGVDETRNTVHIFELKKDGHFSTDDAGRPRQLILKGTASAVRSVAFSQDEPLRVRYVTDVAPETEQVFNLARAVLETPPQAPPSRWRNSLLSPDGWQVRANQGRVGLSNGTVVGQIELNLERQGSYATHAWITDKAGTQSKAIAIGTDLNDIYVYSLPVGGKCRLLRYFRDHTDRIRSLSTSPDSRLLASGSSDASIKIWSLDAVFEPVSGFPESTAWGCVFEVTNQGLKVSQVAPGSIAAARGLTNGDIISSVESPQKLVNPAEMLAAIRSVDLWQQLIITTQREGRRTAIVPGWEPMVSMVANRQGEWGIWTPRGYYEASAHGDHLFGWVENPAQRGGTPKFYSAKEKRGDFEKPDVIRQLFAGVEPPVAVHNRNRPEVRVVQPAWEDVLKPDVPFKVIADIKLPPPADDYIVNAFVGLTPASNPQKQPLPTGEIRHTWDARPTQPFDRVVVRATRRGTQPASGNHVEQVANFRVGQPLDPRLPEMENKIKNPQQTTPKRRLFVAGIAVGESYDGERRRKLRASQNDVKSVASTLYNSRGRLFDLGTEKPFMLLEKEVSAEGFREFVNRIKATIQDQEIRSNDLLVLAVSGHGYYNQTTSTYHYVMSNGMIPWTSTDGSVSFREFTELPCRKLLILDTCHSGGASIENMWKNPVRVFTAAESLVFTSSDSSEESYEIPFTDGSPPASVFSWAFARGCAGEADGFGNRSSPNPADRRVQLLEPFYYVQQQAPILVGPESPWEAFRRGNPDTKKPYTQNPQLKGSSLVVPLFNIDLFALDGATR